MNRLFKTMLGIALCFSSALPAMAEIEIEEDNIDGESFVIVSNSDKIFYSTETITSATDIQRRKDDFGITGALSDEGHSALIFDPMIGYAPDLDVMMLSFWFISQGSFKSELETNDSLTIHFADGKTDEFYINERATKDGVYSVVGILGALYPEDYAVHLMPMNEEMVQYATSDIKSITCGGMTYHIKGHTAPFIKSLFSALFDRYKNVSDEKFSIYLNSVGTKDLAAELRSGTANASIDSVTVGSDGYSDEETTLATLLKKPAGYAGRNPFNSPGIYEVDFKNYASQNSLAYRIRSNGNNDVMIFNNGVVPDNLMGHDCKFVANFKNQILNGYVYQSAVMNREQAENLARSLSSELEGMANVDRSAGYNKDGNSLYGEQFLYGAGSRVTVDARQIGGRYYVSLIVSITHF